MGLQQDEQRTGRRLVPWAGGRRDLGAVHGETAPRLADGGNVGAVPGLRGQDPFRLRFLQAGRCTDGAHRHQPPCHRQ